MAVHLEATPVAGSPELNALRPPAAPPAVPHETLSPHTPSSGKSDVANKVEQVPTLGQKFSDWKTKASVASQFFNEQMQGHRWEATKCAGYALLQSGGVLLTGYLTGLFGQALLKGSGVPQVFGGGLVVVGLVTALVASRKRLLEDRMRSALRVSCDNRLLDGITDQPLGTVQRQSFQSELSTVGQNSHRVLSFVDNNLNIVNNGIQLTTALLALGWIHPVLATGLVVAGIPRLITSSRQIKDRESVDESNKEDFNHFWTGRWTMLQPVFLKELLIFGRAKQRAGEVVGRLQQTQTREVELGQRSAERDALADTCSHVGLLAGTLGLIHLFQTGSISYADAGLALGAMTNLGEKLSSFGALVTSYGENLSMVKRFMSLVTRQPAHTRTNAQELAVQNVLKIAETSGVTLELDKVTFTYPDQNTTAVEELSMSIKPGEFVIVTGKNGGGKSTLINLLAGLYRPQGGAVRVNGVELPLFKAQEWLQNLGILSQEFQLELGASVKDNIEYGQSPNRKGIPYEQAARMAGVDLFVKDMATTIVGEGFQNGRKFSGGQMQRIALARALARRAPILILDEPTAHLDSDGETLLFESFAQLKRDEGYNPTLIYITHRLNKAKSADTITVIHQGSIQGIGRHKDLIENTDSTYHRLYTQDRGEGDKKRDDLE